MAISSALFWLNISRGKANNHSGLHMMTILDIFQAHTSSVQYRCGEIPAKDLDQGL